MNYLKTTLLLAALTGLLMAGGYYMGGQEGALIALVISAVMNLGSYWFSDKIVLRLYRAEPLPEKIYPKLYSIVQELAQNAQIPPPRLYMVDLPVPNAFATGRNPRHAVIGVTPSILELLDERELRAVLAHEMAHISNRDILLSSIAATLAGALSYLAQFAYFLGGSRDENNRNPVGLLIFILLTPLIATLLHLAVSRSREFHADESGTKFSHDPEGLASALSKLHNFSSRRPLQVEPKYEATAHLFIVNPFRSSWLTKLFSTHPPVEERIQRLLHT